MRNLFVVLILFVSVGPIYGQLTDDELKQIDSLKQVVASEQHDSIKIQAYESWDDIIYSHDSELDFELLKNIKALCDDNLMQNLSIKEKDFFEQKRARVNYYLGSSYYDANDYEKAGDYYEISLEFYKEIGDSNAIAKVLNNQGLVFAELGNFPKALDNYALCIELFKQFEDSAGWANGLNNSAISSANIGDYDQAIGFLMETVIIYEADNNDEKIAGVYSNIGLVYQEQGELDKALEYYERALALKVHYKNVEGQAVSNINIAGIYLLKGNTDAALECYHTAKELCEKRGDNRRLTESLNGIAKVYIDLGNYSKAEEYLENALNLSKELNHKYLMSTTYLNLGATNAGTGNYEKAINLGEKGLGLALKIGSLSLIEEAAKKLYDWNKKTGNTSEALKMHELYIDMKDSILREDNQRELVNQEYKYQYEKQKALDDAEFEKEKLLEKTRTDNLLLVKKEQEHKQQIIIYAAVGGLLLVIMFLFILFNRLKLTQKQKTEIEEQKLAIDLQHDELEDSHREIRDSINYAERLQSAILPDFSEIAKHLDDYFIIYKPKDVISGDFYWFDNLNGVNYIAAADCTGHGVPGAMLCVVCSNALNRSVHEHGLSDPNEILNKTREIVIETLGQKEGHIRDGMDIALGALMPNKILFSGANNPLWIVRKTDLLTDEERKRKGTLILDNIALIEYKGNKQPIGRYHHMKDFTQIEVKLYENDRLYFFSDGYVDQFGGELGKKFKSRAFKNLLLESAILPMDEQQQVLSSRFLEWKGEVDQVDDVCVIGVKI